MATQAQAQARNHRAQQAATATAAAAAVGAAVRQAADWPEILTTLATWQLRAAAQAVATMAELTGTAALTKPEAFAGVTSNGFPLSEPLVATIDRTVPAPVAELPPKWWDDAQRAVVEQFAADLERVTEGQVKDAGRSAFQTEMYAKPDWTNYVRVLVPPSCKRCAVLAGRIYRDSEPFSRHEPTCDCQHWPVTSWVEAEEQGLVTSFETLFEHGEVRGLSKADAQAIADGADPNQVVNATRGLGAPGITAAQTVEIFGRRAKVTTEGTTRRARWRKANPSRPVRLRPESIYANARDREDAVRLLRLYGYIREA